VAGNELVSPNKALPVILGIEHTRVEFANQYWGRCVDIDLFVDAEGHRHAIYYIPQIAPASLLYILRQISKWFSSFILYRLDSEIRLRTIIGRLLEILKGILGDIANVGRIAKCTSRCIVRDNDLDYASGFAYPVHLLHEVEQITNMFHDMA
jgi:hypothetical protein